MGRTPKSDVYVLQTRKPPPPPASPTGPENNQKTELPLIVGSHHGKAPPLMIQKRLGTLLCNVKSTVSGRAPPSVPTPQVLMTARWGGGLYSTPRSCQTCLDVVLSHEEAST